jgi:hypothetical protein
MCSKSAPLGLRRKLCPAETLPDGLRLSVLRRSAGRRAAGDDRLWHELCLRDFNTPRHEAMGVTWRALYKRAPAVFLQRATPRDSLPRESGPRLWLQGSTALSPRVSPSQWRADLVSQPIGT